MAPDRHNARSEGITEALLAALPHGHGAAIASAVFLGVAPYLAPP
jgi:hypothetical protein